MDVPISKMERVAHVISFIMPDVVAGLYASQVAHSRVSESVRIVPSGLVEDSTKRSRLEIHSWGTKGRLAGTGRLGIVRRSDGLASGNQRASG